MKVITIGVSKLLMSLILDKADMVDREESALQLMARERITRQSIK